MGEREQQCVCVCGAGVHLSKGLDGDMVVGGWVSFQPNTSL